jgi:hypothetical protein
MKGLFSCFFLLPLFFHSAILHSQIVNIENSRMQSDTTGWMGSAGTSFSFVRNTAKITVINLNAHVQYKTKKDLWLVIGHYGFLKGGSEKFVGNSFGHLRYNHKLNAWLRWEAFTQVQSNYITQIDSRYLLGTGPRVKLTDTKFFHLYAACLLMYEHEKERTKPPVIHDDIRNSSYISFTIRPNDNLEIISTTFYQPLLKKFKDYRILNESVLKAKTGKHFSLKIAYNYLNDRFPAGISPETTYELLTGLQYDF